MKEEVQKHDYAVYPGLDTVWRKSHGNELGVIATPDGYAKCLRYEDRRELRASFIWHERTYTLDIQRDKVFSRLAVVRAVRKWVREIVREAR